MKKAVFFDIDGTLLDCAGQIKTITPNVKKAIRRLQASGDYVFIATGRPYAFLSQEILEFGFDGFILTNGAQVILHNKTIYKKTMEKNFVKQLVQTFENYDIQYILEGDNDSYMKACYKEFYDFYETFGIFRDKIKGDYNLEEVEVQKVEALCPTKEALTFCLSFLNEHPEYDHFASMDAKSVEIYSKKNKKASGILEALKYLDIPIEQSYAFGDGKNDIEMLEAVGCGIAMGNASDEVKEYADKVTDTVQNDGVAAGIEKYIFS